MASIETIGIDFDTTGLKKGQSELKNTEKAAKGAADSLDKASDEAKTLGRESSNAAGMSSKFASALGGIAIAATALKAIKLADEYTSLNARLKLATKSTEEFAVAQESLFRISQNSRTSLSSTMDLYTALARATKDLTISQSQLLSITDTFSKSVIISGGSTASAAAAITQFNQAMASGVLRGEEFNSVSEQAPKIIDILAESLGKTRGELRAMANDGQLTSDIVLPAILKGAEGITAELNKMNTTVAQAATVFMNSTLAMVGTANEATDSTNSLAEAIIGMSDILNVFTKAMKDSSGEGQVFSAVLEGVMVVLETVIVMTSKAALAFNLVGNAIGAAAASAIAFTNNGMDGYNAIMEAANDKALSLVESNNKFTDSILNARKNGAFYRDTMKELTKAGGEQNSANYQVIKSTGISVAAQKEAEKAAKAAAAAAKKSASESASAAKKAAAEILRAEKELAAEREKAHKEYVTDLNNLYGDYDKSVAASKKLVEQAQAEYDQYGLTRTEIEALNIAKQEQRLSELELAQAMGSTYEASKLEIAALKERIKAMKEANSINLQTDIRGESDKNDKAARESAAASAKAIEEEWKKPTENIGNSITDALMRGFEGGKDAAKNFVDTLKNMFKSLVLQPIIKMGVQGGLSAIGLGGLSGAAAAADGVGSLGGLSGLGSMVSSGLGWLSGGGAGVGGIAAGASVAGQGATNAVSGMATSLGGLASGITAALPYIGLAVGAFALLKDAFKGETRKGGGFVYTSDGKVAGTGGPSGGDPTGGAGGKQLLAMVESTNRILSAIGSKSQVIGASGAFESSEKGKGFAYASGVLSGGAQFGDTAGYMARRGSKTPEQAAADYVSAINDAIISALNTANDTPEAVKKILSSGMGSAEIVAAVQAQSQAVSTFSEVIKLLPMEQLTTLSYDAKAGLIELSGGLDSLANNLKTYYDNYYTEAEKTATATKNVTDALSSVGVSLPATREAFRALVDAQDLTTEAGQKAYATLLQVSGSFAELNPIIETTTEATKTESTAKKELTAAELQHADLTKTNTSLQETLNGLLGITAEMLDPVNAALNEQNKILTTQIDGINKKNEADKIAQADKEARDKVAADNKLSLEERLFNATATAAQKREKEIAAYGESNRALAEYVFGVEDSAAAFQSASVAIENAIAAVKQAAATQRALTDKYDPSGSASRAQGDINKAFADFNASNRIPKTAKELADLIKSLDPKVDQAAIDRLNSLSGAFDTVFGAADAANKAAQDLANSSNKDAQAASDERDRLAKQAAEDAKRAAEETRRAMEAITDSIGDAIRSLMGQSEQFAKMQRDEAKATLQSALAIAKAGGSLIGFKNLNEALEEIQNIDENDFSSYFEYAREIGRSVGLLSQLESASLKATVKVPVGSVSNSAASKPNSTPLTNSVLIKGSHANGLNRVPFDGYMAQLHKGEQVLTAREAATGGATGEQVKALREEMKAMMIPLVESSTRIDRRQAKWDGDGMPEVRTVA